MESQVALMAELWVCRVFSGPLT